MSVRPFYTPEEESELVPIVKAVRIHIEPHLPSRGGIMARVNSLERELVSLHQILFDEDLQNQLDEFGAAPSTQDLVAECSSERGFVNSLPKSKEIQECPMLSFRIAEMLFRAQKLGISYSPQLMQDIKEVSDEFMAFGGPNAMMMRFNKLQGRETTYARLRPGYSFSSGILAGLVVQAVQREDREFSNIFFHMAFYRGSSVEGSLPLMNASYFRISPTDYINYREHALKEFEKAIKPKQRPAH